MSVFTLILFLLIGIAGLSATMIIFVKEVFNAAVLLLVCLLAIAGIYVMLNAEFIAVVQIMVYAGGILLLVMFGIMLTARVVTPVPDNRSTIFYLSMLIGASLVSLLWMSLTVPAAAEHTPITPTSFGMELVTSYSLPFELAGILLLITLVAAMTIASHKKFSEAR